ncbi:hypothetical protein Salat_1761000 [Sesamum alatum]|uniref:DUF7377 domain-containing protein n=1 Tax=Sesamum alatum TaxID=300844 RepID=A0AAE1Y8X3_9LAMI|nr:hypothetical protein Salat_1761000 [Sesamum alatum]
MSTDNASKVVNGALPHLELLDICNCPNMSSIPSHGLPSLKELSIDRVERGGALLLHDNQRLRSLSIFTCPSLTHIEVSGQIPQSIEDIYIDGCDKLKSIQISTGDNSLRSLRWFRVSGCRELTDISITMLETCTSIEYMEITECHNLVTLDRVRMPSCLSDLDISGCSKLRSLPKGCLNNRLSYLRDLSIGPFSEEMGLASFCEIFQGIQQLHSSLTTLKLYGWPHFDSLPDQFQHLTALTNFLLRDFGMETLPEWFGNLSCLQHLSFTRCKRLRHLPSKEAILRLTKLSEIFIDECQTLSERCKPEQSEWYKISHIRIISTRRDYCKYATGNRVAADRLADMACGTRENKLLEPNEMQSDRIDRENSRTSPAIASLKDTLNLDSACEPPASMPSSCRRQVWGNVVQSLTQLYPYRYSQLPEKLVSNLRKHYDSLPLNYAQAGFEMFDEEVNASGSLFKLTFACNFAIISWAAMSRALDSSLIRHFFSE